MINIYSDSKGCHLNIDGKVWELDALLHIDDTNISEDYAKQAALFGYFSVKLAEQERTMAFSSMAKDQEYAASDEEWRQQMDFSGVKYTEAVVKSKVIRDDQYIKSCNEFYEQEYITQALKSVVNALRMRADMLVSLGANLRQEYNMTDMSLRKQQDLDASVKHAKEIIKKHKSSS